MRKRLFPRLPIPATGKRERGYGGVEVGWESESGRRRVFGSRFDGFRGWGFDGGWDCFGYCESGEDEAG